MYNTIYTPHVGTNIQNTVRTGANSSAGVLYLRLHLHISYGAHPVQENHRQNYNLAYSNFYVFR
jgi:hypothetical protein